VRCSGCMAWPLPGWCSPATQRCRNKLHRHAQVTHAYADDSPTATSPPPPPPVCRFSLQQRCSLLASAASKRAAGDESGSEDEGQQPRKALEDMSIDEFLQGGFLEAPSAEDAAGGQSDDSDGAAWWLLGREPADESCKRGCQELLCRSGRVGARLFALHKLADLTLQCTPAN